MLLNEWGALNTWQDDAIGGAGRLQGRGFMADFVHGLREDKIAPKRDFAAELAEAQTLLEKLKFEQEKAAVERSRFEALFAVTEVVSELKRLETAIEAKQALIIDIQEKIETAERFQAELKLLKKRREEEELAIIIAYIASH